MKISIVIPTYNEEKYLPKLLTSIKKQTFKDFEVIVADAFSKDKTREIAKKFGAIVVDGGLPAKGRNEGAKIAKGKYIYFLDADVRLPKNFLEKTIDEIEKNKIDLATCYIKPISNLEIDKKIHILANMFIKITSRTKKPYAPGFCIIANKKLHKKIKGFNESLRMSEDHDYVRRMIKFGKFKVLESSIIYVSVRRLKKEGRLNLIKKYLLLETYNLFNIKKNIEYEFGDFSRKKYSKIDKELIKLERQLKSIYRKYRMTWNFIKNNF
ncbi:MAG: glycosyltransferase [Candidatus Aenigmatarchaeota archaeon]